MEQYFGDNLFSAMERNPIEVGAALVQDHESEFGPHKRDALLVIEHSEQRTMALSMTMPSEMAVANVLPEWSDLLCAPPVFYVGGATSPEGALALAVLRPGVKAEKGDFWDVLSNRIVVLNLQYPPEAFEPYVESVRFVAGHKVWEPGELEKEIQLGHWFVAPALPSDVTAGRMVDVWGDILKRQDFPMSVFSTFTSEYEEN